MRYIGLDLGNRTCGLAISDSLGMIATSLYTVRFFEKDLNACLTEVVKVINEKKAEKIGKCRCAYKYLRIEASFPCIPLLSMIKSTRNHNCVLYF